MGEKYYIRARGKVQGPFDIDALKTLANRGRFSRSFEISTDQANWSRAATMPHLFPEPPRIPRRFVPPTVAMPEAEYPVAEALPEFAAPPTSDLTLEIHDPFAAGLQFEREWYYVQDMQEVGPVTETQLAGMIAAGQVVGETLVWTDGMPDWNPAGQVLELAGHFGQAPYFAGQSEANSLGGSGKPALYSAASLILGILGLNILYLLPFAALRQLWLVAGLSSIFYFVSVAAVVLGHLALGRIRRSAGQVSGGKMAVIGLILGYLVIFVVTGALIATGVLMAMGRGLPFAGEPQG